MRSTHESGAAGTCSVTQQTSLLRVDAKADLGRHRFAQRLVIHRQPGQYPTLPLGEQLPYRTGVHGMGTHADTTLPSLSPPVKRMTNRSGPRSRTFRYVFGKFIAKVLTTAPVRSR